MLIIIRRVDVLVHEIHIHTHDSRIIPYFSFDTPAMERIVTRASLAHSDAISLVISRVYTAAGNSHTVSLYNTTSDDSLLSLLCLIRPYTPAT